MKTKPDKKKRAKKKVKKPVRTSPVKKSVAAPKTAIKKTVSSRSARRREKPAPAPVLRVQKKTTEFAGTPDLPQQYNKTYLRAIPRDPFMIFVYWEITEDTTAKAKETMGAETFETAQPVLRLLDITDIIYTGNNEWKRFDTFVHFYASNWYVKIPEPGRTWLIKYGSLTRDGVFHTLMQSNTIQMPHDAVSDVIDEQWSTAATQDIITFSTYPSSLYLRTGDPARTSLFLGSSGNTFKNYGR